MAVKWIFSTCLFDLLHMWYSKC